MAKLILLLGGENTQERHRSRKVMEIYDSHGRDIPILISGSHSGYLGRTVPNWMKPECFQSRDFLVQQGVNPVNISIEDKSLDTLGNFYFSYPLVPKDTDKVHLVTDKFHMKRSSWCSNIVFGESAEFVPSLTSNNAETNYQRFMENMQVFLLSGDMRKYGVKPGDYNALTRFIEQAHPFYCSGKPLPSRFGLMIKLFKNKKFLKMLPTQKHAYGKNIE